MPAVSTTGADAGGKVEVRFEPGQVDFCLHELHQVGGAHRYLFRKSHNLLAEYEVELFYAPCVRHRA